jgi:hypothetical protein
MSRRDLACSKGDRAHFDSDPIRFRRAAKEWLARSKAPPWGRVTGIACGHEIKSAREQLIATWVTPVTLVCMRRNQGARPLLKISRQFQRFQ